MKRLVLAALVASSCGCASAPIPPTYTEVELQAICERQGSVWHPDDLMGGVCEAPGRL